MTARPSRVLGVFAHPDDETFGPGGTLARLAAQGHEVHLVTATRGEAGTMGPAAELGPRALAELRERELSAACRVLGIRPPTVLLLPDSGLAALPREALLRPFVQAIRSLRPRLLLTFHSNGISGHADHRMVTARVVEARELAARDGEWPDLGPAHLVERVWTYCVPESKARQVTYREIHSVPDADLDAVVDVAAFIPQKRDAVSAHASQREFIDRLEAHLGTLDTYWRDEAFVLDAASVPLPADRPRPVADLFAGL